MSYFFGMMAAKPYKRQVEYLESTGTQWIDTGVYAPTGTDIEITFSPNELSTMAVFGGRNGQQIRSCALLVVSASCRFDCGSVQPYIGSNAVAAGHKYKFTYSNNVNYALDDLTTGDHYTGTLASAPANTTQYPLALFALDTAGTRSLFFKGKIYEWKYSRDGVITQHLIPELVGGVPCMWDTLSETPFYNAGTGTFSYA